MSQYVWNGSSFVIALQSKIWNGSSWVEVKGAKIWNGSAWKEFLNASITTGTTTFNVPGGKGFDGNSTTYYGYNDGVTWGPPFTQYGSVEGEILGSTVKQCYWAQIDYDGTSSGNPRTEYEIAVIVSGDYSSGSYAVMINGSIVTGYKTGTYYPSGGGYSYDNTTIFGWSTGLGGGSPPTSNPFGTAGTVNNVQLIPS